MDSGWILDLELLGRLWPGSEGILNGFAAEDTGRILDGLCMDSDLILRGFWVDSGSGYTGWILGRLWGGK